MPKMLLTEKQINKGLSCPTNKRRIEYCDTHLPGLYLEIRATSHDQGTYYLRYKDATGKTCHQKIGRTCDISLKQARGEAKRLRAEIQLGANPRAETRAKKAVMTWRVYMETIYLPHVRAHLRSHANLESLNRIYAYPVLAHRPLNTITLQMAQKLHRDMVDVHAKSPASADHLAKLLRQALNYAVQLNLIEASPVSKIRLFHVDNQVEHFLDGEELQGLLKILAAHKNRTVANIILFLLSTGVRKSTALNAQWDQFDRDKRTWVVPAESSKSRRRHTVVLNEVAMDILDNLSTEGEFRHLFINSRTGKPYTTISKSWAKIRNEAEIPDCRLHDLRHSFASYLANAGCNEFQIMEALNHRSSVTTRRYVHMSQESMQKAASAASDKITEALQANEK